jgi:ubiquitin carboxyl-terminal hydrolase 25/28
MCVGLAGHGQTNLSHHLHTYINAVNVKFFEPHLTNWVAGLSTDSSMENASVEDDETLDLLVCCQCSFYCIASKPLPGVVSGEHLAKLVKDKLENPILGMSGPFSAASALEVLLRWVHVLLLCCTS